MTGRYNFLCYLGERYDTEKEYWVKDIWFVIRDTPFEETHWQVCEVKDRRKQAIFLGCVMLDFELDFPIKFPLTLDNGCIVDNNLDNFIL